MRARALLAASVAVPRESVLSQWDFSLQNKLSIASRSRWSVIGLPHQVQLAPTPQRRVIHHPQKLRGIPGTV
jgi:hypothetical protein